MTYAIQIVTAFLGSLGFSLLFNVRRDRLFPAAFGGLLAWGVYLLLGPLVAWDVPRFFIASLALTLYAEIMARVKKSPATVFLVSASIPLIPGGSLYTTMQYAVSAQWAEFTSQGMNTLLLAGAIAGGMLCMMGILHVCHRLWLLLR